jgi:hypothetical protein
MVLPCGSDHLGNHDYFRDPDDAEVWKDAHGGDYVLETTPGSIWRVTRTVGNTHCKQATPA